MPDPLNPNPSVPALDVPASKPADAPSAPVEAAPAPSKPEPRKLSRKPAAPAPAVAASPSKPEPAASPEPEKGARLLSRLRSQIERDRALVDEAKGYKAELAEYAKGALDGLTKEQRAYVERQAGDNPAKLLATVRELRAAGLLSSPTSAPASTAPKAPAPPAASKSGDDDASVLAEYERLRKIAPVIALDYANRNSDALKRARTRN